MAGADSLSKEPYPNGDAPVVVFKLGPVSVSEDSSGFQLRDAIKLPFSCNVVKAFGMASSITNTPQIKVLNDDSSAVTIVAAVNVAISKTELTVADEGATFCNGCLELYVDSDSGEAGNDIVVELWVRPLTPVDRV